MKENVDVNIFSCAPKKKNALFERRRYVDAVMELSFSQLVKRGSAVCPARYFFVRALYKCVGIAQQALGVGWLVRGKKTENVSCICSKLNDLLREIRTYFFVKENF